jgi:hypothetical protein
MNARVRAMIGVLTTGFFAVSGGLLLAEQRSLGWILLAVAVFRGVVAARQVRALRQQ